MHSTTRSLPRVQAAAPSDRRGHNRAGDAVLAVPGALPVPWSASDAEPVLAASSNRSPQVGDWVPEDTVLEDERLMLLETDERIINGLPHLKVVAKPVITTSVFDMDDEDEETLEDDDPYEYARRAAERQAREARAAKRKKVIRYASLGALLTVVAGGLFLASPPGQELLTNTEVVEVEVEKQKEYVWQD